MPYCPKCDMEFVEGITVCTDCGGPLYESEEAAKAAMAEERAKERARELAREKAMYEEYLKSIAAGDESGDDANGEQDGRVSYSSDSRYNGSAESPAGIETDGTGDDSGFQSGVSVLKNVSDSSDGSDDTVSEDAVPTEEELRALEAEVRRQAQSILPPEPVHVYVDKSQKYDDLKSSASAFLLVGGVLLIVSILCWTGIINIPMAPVSKLIFQGALTVMGVFSLIVFARSSSSAKKLAPQIAEEKAQTRITIDWFTDQYTAEDIDNAISGREDLSEEELSLKRFQIIQDWLVTGRDLPDQAYVDALSEEIYSKLFENQ